MKMKTQQDKIFRKTAVQGRLIFLQPDEKTRFNFTIWFDYTRVLMNDLKEGDLVAVNNFATDGNSTHWSILELVSVLPVHYALGSRPEDLRGFPGYIMAAAGNLPTDWMQQESTSSEDTTKIQCIATPINLEIVQKASSTDLMLEDETNIPMIGSEVKLLSVESTKEILNKNLNNVSDVITVGTLIREPNIEVLMDIQNAIKTHMGIFGFTGVGKSNFISTLINSLVSSPLKIKIIILDLNNEYLGLLGDVLLSRNTKGMVLNIGEKTLSGKVQEFVQNNSSVNVDQALAAYLKDLYLTRGLDPFRSSFDKILKTVLQGDTLKILKDEYSQSVEEFINAERDKLYDDYATIKIRSYLDLVFDGIVNLVGNLAKKLDLTVARTIHNQLATIIGEIENSGDAPGKSTESPINMRINIMKQDLKKIFNPPVWNVKPQNTINFNDIIGELNDESRSSLIIVNSFDPDEMRKFTFDLGVRLYENRRRKGKISPLVSFVFDEADEFIPSTALAGSTYYSSKKVVEMIARRGRKFGIGLTIATQRSTYLDTNIMGQLHTYFVSKLPRETDRERVGEAFAVSMEMFTQTFKFRKGDWLFISHESAGLDSVPIPIHSKDAEERIKNYFNTQSKGT
ncbi:MAG: ATP-binding protein [Thermoplasmataceae archaeon]